MTRLGLWLSDLDRGSGSNGLLHDASAAADAAERAGFDSLWVSDRIATVGGDLDPLRPVFEAYSLLGALATRTRSIRLGALPLGAETRAPSMVAKIVTGIDVISHGRSVVTLGPGHEGGGLDVGRLAEGLQVCRSVLDDEAPHFAGSFYAIDGATNRPRPVQVGGVPLVVFINQDDPARRDARPDVLRVAARYADAVVLGGDMSSVGEAVNVVETASSAHGRRPGSVEVIWTGAASLESGSARGRESSSNGSWSECAAQVASQVRERLAAGAGGCIVAIAGFDQLEAIAALGTALRDVIGSAPTGADTVDG